MPFRLHCSRRRLAILAGMLILGLTVLAYLPAVRGEFLWDDDRHFSENPFMDPAHGLDGLRAIWTQRALYYPLTSTTFWVARRLWGLNPVPYHQLMILLHVANAILLWQLLRRLRVPGAWLAGAIFALHPVNVQSVAWMTELKNVQSGLFYLLALLGWLAFRRGAGPLAYGAALLAFLLALLSKTSTVTLPAALLVIHLWRREPLDRRAVLAWMPFALLSLAAGLMTIYFHKPHVAEGLEWSESLPTRLFIAGNCVWFYLSKLLLPLNLTFVYPRWEIDAARLTHGTGLFALLLLVAVLWRGRRTWGRASLLALAYYVASLLPVLNLFKMYYARYSYVADHWQYLTLMGGAAWLAGGLVWLVGRAGLRGPMAALPPALLLTLFGGLTWSQAAIYRDPQTLWLNTIADNPTAAISYNNLGIYHMERGDYAAAELVLRAGLEHNPTNPELLTITGAALIYLNRPHEALAPLEAARLQLPDDPEVLNNIALAQLMTGQTEPALQTYARVMELKPDFPEPYLNFAHALTDAGRLPEALAAIELGLRILPRHPDLHALRHDLLARRQPAPSLQR